MHNGPRKIVQAMQRWVPERSDGICFLAYHLVEAGTTFPVDIGMEMFRTQMKQLRDHFTVVSLGDAVARVENGEPLPQTMVVTTFDDAYENFYTSAWPVLSELRIPATLYVPVDFIEKGSHTPITGANSLRPCSWGQLRDMTASGLLSIGSHSCTHPDLRMVDLTTAKYEIAESRKRLEDKLGVPVRSFCYPKGLWNRRLEHLVREEYQTAVIGGGWKMHPGNWNPYRLSRTPIRRDTPVDLTAVLSGSVWLEEQIASRFRMLGL